MNQQAATPKRRSGSYLDPAKLHKRRTARKLTQAALAELVGTTQTRYAHWEADESPGIETIAALAVALDCRPETLMHKEGRDRYTALLKALQAAA